MAKCPKCKRYWFWDWDQDIYRYIDGSEVESIYHSYKGNDELTDAIIFRCKCGAINSSVFTDGKTGSSVLTIKVWGNIDWEEYAHSWDPKCLNCKTKDCLKED